MSLRCYVPVDLTYSYQENDQLIFAGFENVDDRFTILETRDFINQHAAHNKRVDYGNGHGTKVASKIVGRLGIAKRATLVPVQVLSDTPDDISCGYNAVWRDLRRRRAGNRNVQAVSASHTMNLETVVRSVDTTVAFI
jgi:subtilisin family serine protease